MSKSKWLGRVAVAVVALTAAVLPAHVVRAQPAPAANAPKVVVAEGERFTPQGQGDKDWKLTPQDLSWASHTYGGMWVTNGAGLGAPADSDGAVATQAVQIPAAGKYRVWSKYQAPPYFNYLHKIEVAQNGKTVYSHVYGKAGTDRLWSFGASSNELWWFWGVDHDAAEAPAQMADLAAGPAEVRLTTVKNDAPAGARFVDFIVLTTEPGDTYQGAPDPVKKTGVSVGTPFAEEALAATKLYARFQNTSGKPAQVTLSRSGHFQPQYGGANAKFPAQPVAAGAWSEWFDIGPFVRLVHNEGVTAVLEGAQNIPVQVARDAAGKDAAGDFKVGSGEVFNVPLDITWNKESKAKPSRELAEAVIAASKGWRQSNGGKKPEVIAYYGAFNGTADWVNRLKDALGYNTMLPDNFRHLASHVWYGHIFGADAIRKYGEGLKSDAEKKAIRLLSFGDEISLGEINYDDPAMQKGFVDWLAAKKVTQADLGVAPAQAKLTKLGPDANPRLVWYSKLFNEEQRFAVYRESTEAAKQSIGQHVLTGANYSPHHLALCYGPIYQWVDIFKHQGMSMYWAEDYIFSVPEVPQILSWMFAEMHAGTKYHHQPIHMYVMPHAPGQTPGNLRRSMVYAIGAGAAHIDNFWVAPQEGFTENYVAWGYDDSFRVLHDSILDSAEVEKVSVGGKLRPNRVALVLSKATDFNETNFLVDKAQDPFISRAKNADPKVQQTLCRKDQQMLYLALRQAQQGVDLITEDDIVELDALKGYDAVYFAGEWIDHRIVPRLDAWVQGGGVLYAAAGLGRFNEFGEPDPAMQKLLGLSGSQLTKNLYVIRTLLELPLAPPIGTITLDGKKIPAIGIKQVLTPVSGAEGAKVIGTWDDGAAAVTVREYGKGKAFAVGTLAGNSYMKTGLRVTPWARGGFKMVYHPTDFDPAATQLVRLGVAAKQIPQEVVCSNNFVEPLVIDNAGGTLVTLVNWTNGPAKAVKVSVKMPAAPKAARQVGAQKDVPVTYENGTATFTVDIPEADYVLLTK